MNQHPDTDDINPKEILQKLRQFCNHYYSQDKKQSESNHLNEFLADKISRICFHVRQLFQKECSVVRVSSPAFVFGDIHGNLKDVIQMEQRFLSSRNQQTQDSTFIFLGDFVDRGKFSVECVVFLFVYKLISPKRLVLVRGNHEVRDTNHRYTFNSECIQKYGHRNGHIIWDVINSVFEHLPIAAIVDESILCVHGGITKQLNTIQEMSLIPKPLTHPPQESLAAHEILWNDPVDSMPTYNQIVENAIIERKIKFVPNGVRKTGSYYTQLAVDQFFKNNNLTLMIRAHECVKDGFKTHFNGKVITVFSSSNYCQSRNKSACIFIGSQTIRPLILKDFQ